MNKLVKTAFTAVAAGTLIVVVMVIVVQREDAILSVPESNGQSVATTTAKVIETATAPPVAATPAADLEPASVAAAAPSEMKKEVVKPAGLANTQPAMVINGYELQDPLARFALNYVGSDADADAYWIGAINDPAMPAEERKDLIEDLNEDGLMDPHHPTPEDLSLIASRIPLVEQQMANAMDEVNRDAFAEVHKDLVGLLNGQEPK